MPVTRSAGPTASPAAQPTIAVLQAVRAVAALLVVLFHDNASIFASPKYGGHPPFGHIFDFGHAGVEIFFVLSGFVILYIHWSDIGRPERVGSYVWKRIRRIYPVYWAVLLLVLVAYFAVPSLGDPLFRKPATILSSLLLIHFKSDIVVMDVAWTLYHEILFYAVFALVILDRRLGKAMMIAWLITSVVALVVRPAFPLSFWFSPLHLLFAMGMFVAWWLRRASMVRPGLVTVSGILLFVLAGMEEVYVGVLPTDARSLVYGFAAAYALAGLISLERHGRLRTPKLLRLLGDASYSIYLVHLPVLSLLAKLFLRSDFATAINPMVAFVLMLVLAVLPGVAFHLVAERPLLAYLGSLRIGSRMSRERPIAIEPGISKV